MIRAMIVHISDIFLCLPALICDIALRIRGTGLVELTGTRARL